MAAKLLTGLVFAGCLLPGLAHADAGRVTFVVSDETDPQEIAEDTSVFVNGAMVAHFTLDPLHPADSISVSIPAAARYDYALCGHITLRKPDGQTAMHQVASGATLTDLGGHAFQLLAAADFTLFYMSDQTTSAQPLPGDVHRTDTCSLPVS